MGHGHHTHDKTEGHGLKGSIRQVFSFFQSCLPAKTSLKAMSCWSHLASPSSNSLIFINEPHSQLVPLPPTDNVLQCHLMRVPDSAQGPDLTAWTEGPGLAGT